MLMTPWQVAKKFWSWLVFMWQPKTKLPPIAPPPKIGHRICSKQIVAGRVIVMNTGSENIRLEGPVLRSLLVRAGEIVTVTSPLLEPVWRIKSVVMDTNTHIPTTKSVEKEIAFINEWDGFEVVENMIEEYARARAYDIMTPAQLKYCTLPLSGADLQAVIDRIGLKAQRENENVSAQA